MPALAGHGFELRVPLEIVHRKTKIAAARTIHGPGCLGPLEGANAEKAVPSPASGAGSSGSCRPNRRINSAWRIAPTAPLAPLETGKV
jgi:hypothetical protein